MSLKKAQQEFDEAKKELQAQQTIWRTQLAEIKRNIVVDTAKHTKISDQLRADSVTLDSVTQELHSKKQETAELIVYSDNLVAKIEEKQQIENGLVAKSSELQEEVGLKQAELDSGLENYKKTCIQEIDLELESYRAQVVELEKVEDAITTHILQKREDLNQLEARNEATIQEAGDRLHDLTVNLEKSENLLVSTSAQVEKLLKELTELEYKRDQVLSVTRKAKVQYEQFVDYEARARKVLETKDRELQDKQAELQEGEVLLKNRRSFLNEL